MFTFLVSASLRNRLLVLAMAGLLWFSRRLTARAVCPSMCFRTSTGRPSPS